MSVTLYRYNTEAYRQVYGRITTSATSWAAASLEVN